MKKFKQFIRESKTEMIICNDSNIKQMVQDHFDELHLLDVSQVTDLSYIFKSYHFKNIKYMFVDCYKFNQDLSKWNLKSIQNYLPEFDIMFDETCPIKDEYKPKFKNND